MHWTWGPVLCITTQMAECYWSEECSPLIRWPSLEAHINRDREKSSGQAKQFNIWKIWIMERTSAQPEFVAKQFFRPLFLCINFQTECEHKTDIIVFKYCFSFKVLFKVTLINSFLNRNHAVRGFQKDLSWLTNSVLVYKPKCGGGGGVQPMGTAVHTRARINIRDLTQYLS